MVDADGLNALSKIGMPNIKAQAVFTPHVGEMARLTDLSVDEILEDVIGVATRYAKQWGGSGGVKTSNDSNSQPKRQVSDQYNW